MMMRHPEIMVVTIEAGGGVVRVNSKAGLMNAGITYV